MVECVVWTDALVVTGCDVVVASAAALDLTVCSLLLAVVPDVVSSVSAVVPDVVSSVSAAVL